MPVGVAEKIFLHADCWKSSAREKIHKKFKMHLNFNGFQNFLMQNDMT